jgi:lysophospholipase L1-like esterase
VLKRRFWGLSAVAAVTLAGCLVLSLWIVKFRDAAAARSVSSVVLTQRPQTGHVAGQPRPRLRAVDSPLGACEAGLERGPRHAPTVAIVGASYTAGVGPDNPAQSWAVGTARLLRWNAVIYGVPGAGYVHPGTGGRGPMSRLLAAEGLGTLDPALVIIQAGHDDVGVPAGFEARGVAATVRQVQAADPGARIALLTTFSGSLGGYPALRATDHAIVAAGTAADPGVIIMDPLAGHWRYQHADGGLHPTAGGDAWIARAVAGLLAAHGVAAAPPTPAAPVICDVTVGVGKAATA